MKEVHHHKSKMQRSLEVANKSSMNPHSLSNMITSMRCQVKSSKVCAIHRLTHQIARIRRKRGSDAQMQANEKKIDRLTDILQIIKRLNTDKVAKFALGNRLSMQDVASKYKNDGEMKALVLLSLQKPLLNRVTKWREEHSDWNSLAAFMIQHIGKRYNPKTPCADRDIQAKPKFKHQLKSSNDPITHVSGRIEDGVSRNEIHLYSEGINRGQASSKTKKEEFVSTSLTSTILKRNKETQITRANIEISSKAEPLDIMNSEIIEQRKYSECESDNKDDFISKKRNSEIRGSNSKSDMRTEKKIKDLTANTRPKKMKRENETMVQKLNVVNMEVLTEGSNRGGSEVHKIEQALDQWKIRKDPFFISRTTNPGQFCTEQCVSDVNLNGYLSNGAACAVQESTFMLSLAESAPKFRDYVVDGQKHGEKKEYLRKVVSDEKIQGQKEKSLDRTKDLKPNCEMQVSGDSLPEKLHPSWEASKLKRLKTSLKAFKGKKKTFVD